MNFFKGKKILFWRKIVRPLCSSSTCTGE